MLLLVTIAVYANGLFSGFVWDDKHLVVEKQEFFSHPGNALVILASPDVPLGAREVPPYYRPLDVLSYMLDHYFWGLHPFWYHLENLMLHAVVVCLFYLLLMEVFEDNLLAFVSALLFALYPVNTEAVDAIFNRNVLFCAAFSMASLLFLAKGGFKWTIMSLLSYFLALLSKEPALVLPLFLSSMRLAGGRFKTKKTVLAGFFALTVVYFMIRNLVLGVFIAKHRMGFSLSRLKLIAMVYFEHFRLFVFPFRLNALYTGRMLSFTLFKAAVSVAGVALLLYFSLRKKTHAPVRSGAQWILWGLLPVSNLVEIPSAPVAERYQYTIVFGFVLILGYLLEKAYQKKAIAGIMAIVVLCFALGVRTFERNFVWRDDVSLFTSMIHSDPGDAIAYYNLGNYYGEKGDLNKAVFEFRMALARDPDFIKAHVNLGAAYGKEGNLDGAITEFEKALSMDPCDAMVWVNLGMSNVEKGRIPDALSEFRKAASLNPPLPEAHLALGICYEKEGLFKEAIREFQAALKLDPRNTLAFQYLDGIKKWIEQ